MDYPPFVHLGPGSKRLFSAFPSLITFLLGTIFQAVILNLISQEYRNVEHVFFLTTCKIRHHVFTTFDARIRNVKCKNKNVLEVLKSSKYISLFEPRQSITVCQLNKWFFYDSYYMNEIDTSLSAFYQYSLKGILILGCDGPATPHCSR